MQKDSIHTPGCAAPADAYGIPSSVRHSPQTDLPVWQFVHKLSTPVPNLKNTNRPYTHICMLCAAAPPLRSTIKAAPTWKNALMRQGMSTNAVAHVQRVHPREFQTIADSKLQKRDAVLENARKNSTTFPKTHDTRGLKFTTSSEKRVCEVTLQSRTQQLSRGTKRRGDDKRLERPSKSRKVRAKEGPVDTQDPLSKCDKVQDSDTIRRWLLSSGAPVSMLCDRDVQQLLKLLLPEPLIWPFKRDLIRHVQDEFVTFGHLLQSYLAAESRAALGLPFVSICHEFRPMDGIAAERDVTHSRLLDRERAFFSLSIGLIDSHWRKVDLALAAKVVPRTWDKQVNNLVSETAEKAYNIQSISDYARFNVVVSDDDLPYGEDESFTSEQEDLLTRTLRHCVHEALGVGLCSLSGVETNVCRILRLLQELVHFFEPPDRSRALAEIGAGLGADTSLCSINSMETLASPTSTSIGALAKLFATSCAQFPLYQSYFQSPTRPSATNPSAKLAWTQLTTQDWQTVAEIEAILNQLGQFCLNDRLASRTRTVTPSYTMLFRRLLSVATAASSFKGYFMDESSIDPPLVQSTVQRKAKCVDDFTLTGQQCLVQLRQLIVQNFPSPSTPSAVDDEIKAMLLDPRVSSKVGDLVTDTHALCRAQETLRQEHRAAFELLTVCDGDEVPGADNETKDELDDEFSALLTVEGPKNQSPTVSSTTISSRHSSRGAVSEKESRAWREWQNVCVEWNTLAQDGADLFHKGKYNLLKLYHHVNILEWFRDVGQHAHPAASLLARIYLSQHSPPSQFLMPSLSHFAVQEEAIWVSGAAETAEMRCILHQNWRQYQELSSNAARSTASDKRINPGGR
uniref:Uncharacterized protein n=1 Tax=Peronospora matthiolae TaxID=2874970 RepID=A0AAV1TU66_9STRA